jgi:hypothetical protein
MVTASYKNSLKMAASLNRDEQLRLIRELTLHAAKATDTEEQASVLELRWVRKSGNKWMPRNMSVVNAPHGMADSLKRNGRLRTGERL